MRSPAHALLSPVIFWTSPVCFLPVIIILNDTSVSASLIKALKKQWRRSWSFAISLFVRVSLTARCMGPTWDPLGDDRTRGGGGGCWPHEPYYMGCVAYFNGSYVSHCVYIGSCIWQPCIIRRLMLDVRSYLLISTIYLNDLHACHHPKQNVWSPCAVKQTWRRRSFSTTEIQCTFTRK